MMENKAEHMAIGIGAEIELLASHFNRSAPCSATGPQNRELDGTAQAGDEMIPSDQSGYELRENRMSGALEAGREWK
ncbi:hypothetical protein [Rhizobium laguerreae]|nr:hypothetical protein [Rhizobium laguerreae]MBY3182854.1 hypothetical protein [Rhizobium laguerreae]MBY3223058.1 hypothetical protein [Rhizobium laguerreae]